MLLILIQKMPKMLGRVNSWRDTFGLMKIKYLKRIANGKPKKVTLEKINKKFNLNLSLRQLNNCMSNNNIKVNIRHTWTNEQS